MGIVEVHCWLHLSLRTDEVWGTLDLATAIDRDPQIALASFSLVHRVHAIREPLDIELDGDSYEFRFCLNERVRRPLAAIASFSEKKLVKSLDMILEALELTSPEVNVIRNDVVR